MSARASTDVLFSCMSRTTYALELAGAPLPAMDADGTVQCLRPRRIGATWTGAIAWDTAVEQAREAAMQQDLFVQGRRAAAALEVVATGPDIVGRASHLERVAMTTLAGLVVGTDLAEQALMHCTAAPPRTAKLVWEPSSRVRCDGWPVAESQALSATGGALELSRETRCTQGFRAHVSEDWRSAYRCDASCRSELTVHGWAGDAIWRPGEPRRGTSEEAEAALARAMGQRDYHQLGVVTGGLLFEPLYAATFKSDPTAFWASIEHAKQQGRWAEVAEWTHLGGVWVLGFKR
jgi:hypothetical protein